MTRSTTWHGSPSRGVAEASSTGTNNNAPAASIDTAPRRFRVGLMTWWNARVPHCKRVDDPFHDVARLSEPWRRGSVKHGYKQQRAGGKHPHATAAISRGAGDLVE